MLKLDRGAVARPDCLDNHDYRTQTWDDLAAPCRTALREALSTMQGARCAYCESPLFDGAHIEHFRRKNPAHFPELTFEWSNLFFSCEAREHCGHFKDRKDAPPYDPADLIKPDTDDPEEFLYFSASGEVRVLGHIDATRVERAEATIKVFGLDSPQLSAARRAAARRYLREGRGNLDAILDLDPTDRDEFVHEELAAIAGAPYSTTLRHLIRTETR